MVEYLPRADKSAVSAINRLLRRMEDPHRQVCIGSSIVGRVWIILLKVIIVKSHYFMNRDACSSQRREVALCVNVTAFSTEQVRHLWERL
jgi:hypothetical protein